MVRHDRLCERGKDLYRVRAIYTNCGGAGMATRPAIIPRLVWYNDNMRFERFTALTVAL